jgi:hypothetical protein
VNRGWWAALVLAALLSGCTNGAQPKTVVPLGDGSQLELKDATATGDKGSISGVAVDAAIRPVSHVDITLLGPQIHAATDKDGLFTVDGLEPGLYTLSANATGYLPTQTTAEVKAGETAKVRLVLATDNTPRPYHNTQKFEGFVQAGNGLFDQAYQLFVKDETGVDFCQCQFYYSTDPAWSTQVVEVQWTPSVADPAEPSSGYWAIWDENSSDYIDNGCDNPCYGRTEAGNFSKDATNFHMDVWLDSDWVQYQQKFTVYLTVFYNGEAAKGWSFVKGDP